MRRVNVLLLSGLQLVRARLPGFSIHDDLLAHPQFEVILSNDFIPEQEALALLGRNDASKHSTYSASFPTQADLAASVQSAQDAPPFRPDSAQSPNPSPSTYELMNLSSLDRYLCAIPVIAPPEPSPSQSPETSELARAEEARELERASANGWQLLSHMENQCLYFMAGWWSYSFCEGKQVVQYHALPRLPNAGQPPKQDPNTAAYVLGRLSSSSSGDGKTDEWDEESSGSEESEQTQENKLVQIKGDQRYLVQKLDSGTVCDLTGRDRTIEIQYHCAPGTHGDRISWIKEVTTCTYLMVVSTPRLCEEAVFLPPQETIANPITCRPILAPDDPRTAPAGQTVQHTLNIEDGESEQVPSEQAEDGKPATAPGGKAPRSSPWEGINVGGVIIGARNLLGPNEDGSIDKPKAKLPRLLDYEKWWNQAQEPQNAGDNGNQEGTADSEGQQHLGGPDDYEDELSISAKELEILGFDATNLEILHQQLTEMVGEKGWKIEAVQAEDGAIEYRVTIDEEEEEDSPGGGHAGEQNAQGDGDGPGDRIGSQERFFDAV